MARITAGSVAAGKELAAHAFNSLDEKEKERHGSSEKYTWQYLIPLALNRLKAIRKDYKKNKKGKVRLGRPASAAGKPRGT